MLKNLTNKQRKLMYEVRDEWLDNFFSLKFDEEKARELIIFVYDLRGLSEPEVIFLDSPLACYIYAISSNRAVVLSDEKVMKVAKQVKRQVAKRVKKKVANLVGKRMHQVYEQISQIVEQVMERMTDQVDDQIEERVWEHVMLPMWKQEGERVKDQIAQEMTKQLKGQVRGEAWSRVVKQVKDQAMRMVKGLECKQIWKKTSCTMVRRMIRQMHQGLLEKVPEEPWRWRRINLQYSLRPFHYGNSYDFEWVSFYDFFERIGILNHEKFHRFKELVKANIFFWVGFEKLAVVSKPPVFLNRDERGGLHCTHDYAIYFKDGFGQHYIHGVYFPPDLFEKFKSGRLGAKEVLTLENTEQKAVLIQEFGYEKILEEIGDVKVLDVVEDSSRVDGKHIKYEVLEFPLEDGFDLLTCRAVRVEDHSTHKVTVLGVPRTKQTRTCKGAIAWTFALKTEEYEPVMEA